MSVAEIIPPVSKTPPERDPGTGRFVTGNIGGGRPKGSRNKLAEIIFADSLDDWQEGGREALRRLREEDPAAYARFQSSLLPKELILHETPLDGMERDDVRVLVETLQRALQAVASNPDAARELLAALPLGTR